jgi:hypothetical protein
VDGEPADLRAARGGVTGCGINVRHWSGCDEDRGSWGSFELQRVSDKVWCDGSSVDKENRDG